MDPLRVRCGFANCYLLKTESGACLVDAGNPGDEKTIEKALEKFGLHPRDLSLVLLTHGHPDHTGAAGYFQKVYGIPVALHPADTAGRTAQAMSSRGLFGKVLLAVSRRAVPQEALPKMDVPLQEGMRLDAYGVAGQVLSLPGHTPGSVGVLLDDGNFLCGDVLMNFVAPCAAHMAEDFAALDGSVARLEEYDIKRVWPGHGGAFAPGRVAAAQ